MDNFSLVPLSTPQKKQPRKSPVSSQSKVRTNNYVTQTAPAKGRPSSSRNNSQSKLNTSQSKTKVKKMKKPSEEVQPRVTAYQRTKHGIPNMTFGRSARESPLKYHNGIPGPGSYQPEEVKSRASQKFSSMPRSRSKSPLTPGPGAYSPQKKGVVGFSQGKEKKGLKVQPQPTPGPGAYDHMSVPSQANRVGFLKEQRKIQYDQTKNNPGPGTYQPSSQTGASYSFGKQSQRSAQKANCPLGPGQYQTSPERQVQRKVNGFGTEKRVLFKTNDQPGPGTYDCDDNGLSYMPTLL